MLPPALDEDEDRADPDERLARADVSFGGLKGIDGKRGLPFPLINHARHVCFLVGAAKNASLIERVLEGDPQFPASRVNPSAGEVTWIIAES